MARSLHTQRLEQRAARRIARPYSKRSTEGVALSGKGRAEPTSSPTGKRLPIKIQKPLSGTLHPLHRRDIRDFLATLGPTSTYGLKAISLRQQSACEDGSLTFAEYVAPGEICLYAAPQSPWKLPFIPSQQDLAAFTRHGARIMIDRQLNQTTVTWEPSNLKAFYLVEALAHEIGHHLLQYHKGKRSAVLCRQSDHEIRADLQSRRAVSVVGSGSAG